MMQEERVTLKSTKTPKYYWLVFTITFLIFIIGCYVALRFGAVQYSNQEVFSVLQSPLIDSNLQDIIIDIRLPRIIAAILVGSAMATAGLIMQGVTRNSIAEPGILGINTGAALGLIIAYAFLPSVHYMLRLVFCLIGSTITAVIVFAMSYIRQQGYHQLRLILSGVMISTLFNAIGQALTIYFNLSTSVIGWQSGGLVSVNWKMLAMMAPFITGGLVVAQLFSHQLTILSLNETVAKALGQRTTLITVSLLAIVLLLSASSVAIIGSIAFVGLIIPHFVHLFVQKNYTYLLPLTMLIGGTFLLWVDIVCRTLNPPYETPLSAIVSVVGLPVFLWLIRKGRHL